MVHFMRFALILSLISSVAVAADKKTSSKKHEYMKIDDDESTKKKPTYYKIDEDEDDENVKAESEKPKEPTWEEMGGQSFTGVPRLIRQDPMTEVFFRDLKDSYVIHLDSKHNATFKAFDEAAKANRPVSFRADPVSRRILVVDGVNGVKAPAPAPASTGGPTKAGSK